MRRALAGLVALLAAVSIAVVGAPAAQASATVSNADGRMTGQRAAAADPGYYGTIEAYPTACVVLERKNISGYWVRVGFENADVIWNELRVCYDFNYNPQTWRIHTNSYPVYGLRFVSNQGLTKTLCSSQSACLSNLA